MKSFSLQEFVLKVVEKCLKRVLRIVLLYYFKTQLNSWGDCWCYLIYSMLKKTPWGKCTKNNWKPFIWKYFQFDFIRIALIVTNVIGPALKGNACTPVVCTEIISQYVAKGMPKILEIFKISSIRSAVTVCYFTDIDTLISLLLRCFS